MVLYISLAVAFILLLALILLKKQKKKYRLKKDSTGVYQYHKDSEFLKKEAYDLSKEEKKSEDRKLIAVIEFRGDIKAKQHNAFAKLVDEVEVNKDEIGEVVVTVTSAGGMVSTYGRAYSEMERLRNLGLKLTVCIDTVAASGGYLMSLPAHKIIAAPFAMVGSVGVVAFVPNIREFLTNLKINPRTFTAGKYKRTISLTDEGTPEERSHFQKQLETIHEAFVSVVKKYRENAVIEEIETGDHWSAEESVNRELGLVDELGTSNAYLLERNKKADLLILSQKKNRFEDGIFRFFVRGVDYLEGKVVREL